MKPKYTPPEPIKHIGENLNPNRINSLIPMTLEGKDSMILQLYEKQNVLQQKLEEI